MSAACHWSCSSLPEPLCGAVTKSEKVVTVLRSGVIPGGSVGVGAWPPTGSVRVAGLVNRAGGWG